MSNIIFSMCHQYKNIKGYFTFPKPLYGVFKIQRIFYVDSTSQFGLAPFQVPNSLWCIIRWHRSRPSAKNVSFSNPDSLCMGVKS